MADSKDKINERRNAFEKMKTWETTRVERFVKLRERLEAQIKVMKEQSQHTTKSINWLIQVMDQRAAADLSYAQGLVSMLGESLPGQTRRGTYKQENSKLMTTSTVIEEAPIATIPATKAKKKRCLFGKKKEKEVTAETMEALPAQREKKIKTLDHRHRPEVLSPIVEKLAALQIQEAKELQMTSDATVKYLKDVRKERTYLETEVIKILNGATTSLKKFVTGCVKCDSAWVEFDRIFSKTYNQETRMEPEESNKKAAAREDPWLAEKRYVAAEVEAQDLLKVTVNDIHAATSSLQEMEGKRSSWVKSVVENCIKQNPLKVAADNHNTMSSALSQIEMFDVRQCCFVHLLNGFLSNMEPMDAKQVSAKLQHQDSKRLVATPTVSPYLSENTRLMTIPVAPKEGSVIAHEGKMQHPVGMLNRFKPGHLILSSDRFLHMLENEAKPTTPFWSVDLDHSAIAMIPVKGGGSVIQIQEVRPGLGKKRRYQLKASDHELLEWLNVLKSNVPKCFTAEAQAAAEAAPEISSEPIPEEPPAAPVVPQETPAMYDSLILMEEPECEYQVSSQSFSQRTPLLVA